MDASEEQIIIKILDEDTVVSNKGAINYNPGLRALLSIKKFSATLEKDYSELLQVESQFDKVYKKGMA